MKVNIPYTEYLGLVIYLWMNYETLRFPGQVISKNVPKRSGYHPENFQKCGFSDVNVNFQWFYAIESQDFFRVPPVPRMVP